MELISQGSGGSAFYLGHNPSHIIRGGDQWLSAGVPYPSDGLTHQFAYVRSSSNTLLYIDGSLAAQTGAVNISSGGSFTRFGRQYGPHAEYFNGTLDNVRIYDGALSASEINAVSAVPEPSSALMVLAGLAGLGALRRRRR
jgi:hypothetical protein